MRADIFVRFCRCGECVTQGIILRPHRITFWRQSQTLANEFCSLQGRQDATIKIKRKIVFLPFTWSSRRGPHVSLFPTKTRKLKTIIIIVAKWVVNRWETEKKMMRQHCQIWLSLNCIHFRRRVRRGFFFSSLYYDPPAELIIVKGGWKEENEMEEIHSRGLSSRRRRGSWWASWRPAPYMMMSRTEERQRDVFPHQLEWNSVGDI